jgi:hypothetical protein
MKAWVRAERLTVTYEDGLWRDGVAQTAWRACDAARQGRRTGPERCVYRDNRRSLQSGPYGRAGRASRTTLPITGATSYGVGVNGNSTQFGNLLGIALGSTNNGVIGATAFYANTKVRVTANGGNFTAGKVRLIVYFLEMSVPGA